jgi:REP element-mobilizing transposase RayT
MARFNLAREHINSWYNDYVMARSFSFADGEWYHCFSRGVDKRVVFERNRDYERFLMLLYACNSTSALHISNIGTSRTGPTLNDVLRLKRESTLVHIGAYAILPNHYHLLLKSVQKNGISTFMQKLGTAYTMYFNIKYERTGALFSGRYKAKHVAEDRYFQRLVSYIHANPADLKDPHWTSGNARNERAISDFLACYRFSSLPDYIGEDRPERIILAIEDMLNILKEPPSIKNLLRDARDFVKNIEK